ncbi:MAG TPA: phenylacetate-CoA oxygenase subunit PaaI [Candidatus Thioglobus sp.]|nr:phenylacetate-CoA oxygenase subunit PaaI [Candidatus Thioglobus sp.]
MPNIDIKQATLEYAIRLGDDSLILGHRLSEWCSNGPFLEEELALSNTSLDYLGRARMLYSYAAELSGTNKTEDDYAYLRDAREFHNHLIHELPCGDFAFTITRQLFIDLFNIDFLKQLILSNDKTLGAIAAKGIKETQYHLRRSREWVIQLGDGTKESHDRMQKALDSLWGYRIEMFEVDDLELQLIDAGVAVDSRQLKSAWQQQLSNILSEATLTMPNDDWTVRGGREGYHTESLGHILTEMQFVHRSMPGLKW